MQSPLAQRSNHPNRHGFLVHFTAPWPDRRSLQRRFLLSNQRLIIKARDLSILGAVLSRSYPSSPSSVRSDLRHPWPLRTPSSPTMAPRARPPHASPPSTVRCRPAVSTTPSLSPPSSRARSIWWMAPRAPPPETQVALPAYLVDRWKEI